MQTEAVHKAGGQSVDKVPLAPRTKMRRQIIHYNFKTRFSVNCRKKVRLSLHVSWQEQSSMST